MGEPWQPLVGGSSKEKTTQAILAKAFRGELVPTEAELARREGRGYEPASVLLERIRAERALSPRPSPPRGEGRKPLPRSGGGVGERATSAPEALLAHLQPGRAYSRAEACGALGLTSAEWTWAIRDLKNSGRVVQEGERRGTRYRLASDEEQR